LPIPNGDILIFGAGEFCESDCEDYYAVRTDSTLSLPPFIGIHQISNEIPERFNLYQNFPNPFNPSTKIRFDIPSIGQRLAFDTRLVVYDILGREIAVLANTQLSPGSYEVEFDGSRLASGLYFYQLQIAETTRRFVFNGTKKMVLIK
jgi:hypothetical protein